jgi:hypothetical protein
MGVSDHAFIAALLIVQIMRLDTGFPAAAPGD